MYERVQKGTYWNVLCAQQSLFAVLLFHFSQWRRKFFFPLCKHCIFIFFQWDGGYEGKNRFSHFPFYTESQAGLLGGRFHRCWVTMAITMDIFSQQGRWISMKALWADIQPHYSPSRERKRVLCWDPGEMEQVFKSRNESWKKNSQSLCPAFPGTDGHINKSAAFSLPANSMWSTTELSRDKFSKPLLNNMKMFSLEKAFSLCWSPHGS